MAKCFILLLLLVSIWPTRLLAQGSLRIQELSIMLPCRIVGVTLVNKKVDRQLNFTEAKEACRLLGLTLASKDQVEAAWKFGFETCSYAWVEEGFSVIPRILPNPKCGKNGLGVLIWRAPLSRTFGAYCYNSSANILVDSTLCHKQKFKIDTNSYYNVLHSSASQKYVTLDTWVNSCLPEIMTTNDPMFDTQSPMYTTEFAVSDSTYSASSPYPATPALGTTPASASTLAPRRTKMICITETVTDTSTVSTESEQYTENEATFKNEAVGFGGVPTALLVLALLFFGAAAGLAVCYVKRYVKAFPFTNKSQQKEMIETKVVKEEKADDSNPNDESKKTAKSPEEPKSQPKTTVRCLEAEV